MRDASLRKGLRFYNYICVLSLGQEVFKGDRRMERFTEGKDEKKEGEDEKRLPIDEISLCPTCSNLLRLSSILYQPTLPLPVPICPFSPLFCSSFPLPILYILLPSASEPCDTTDSPLIRISPTCSMALNENGISIRSIGARPRRFKGAKMETAREAVNLESAETSGPTSRRTVSSVVPSARLLAIVQSTSTTLIGFINTIKRGEL